MIPSREGTNPYIDAITRTAIKRFNHRLSLGKLLKYNQACRVVSLCDALRSCGLVTHLAGQDTLTRGMAAVSIPFYKHLLTPGLTTKYMATRAASNL